MFLLLIVYFPSLIFARIDYSKENHCLDDIQTGALSLGCPHNQLLKLGRIIYGYSWSNDCSYIDKDCIMDVPRDDIICLTTRNCTVRVVEHPLILQDCWNLVASYVQAEFECVTDYSLQNICQLQDRTLSNGFLSTPNYPNGFSLNQNCLCALSTSPGHSIVLEIIDFRLPSCTDAGLILWLGHHFQTKCLTQDPVILTNNTQQNITLRFYTLTNMKHGGFLIKYSVLPESNNATVRLQCYTTTGGSRSPIVNNFLTLQPSIFIENTVGSKSTEQSMIINPNDLMKRFPPAVSNFITNKQQQQPQKLQGFNHSTYEKDSKPSRFNMTFVIICIITVIGFLIILNALIWFIFSLRANRSKPTSSLQNLYSHQLALNNENQQTNRLKTLHSLLYPDQKTVHINPITTNLNRDIHSTLSEYHIPSISQKEFDECLSSSNLNHGFIIQSKSNPIEQEPRQINSWDDI